MKYISTVKITNRDGELLKAGIPFEIEKVEEFRVGDSPLEGLVWIKIIEELRHSLELYPNYSNMHAMSLKTFELFCEKIKE